MDLERLEIAINARIDGFEAGIDQADKGILRLANSAKEAGESLTKYVTLPLGLLAGASIKTAGDMQALEKGFAAVYKGAGDVGVELKKVQELAKQPGLGLKEAEQGAIRLMAVGFSAEEARKSLAAFGNAVATTGGGKNELDRITVQLGQLSSKGKVLSQDLRPIIEAAPAAAQALQKLYGTVDASDIQAQLAAQEKSSKEFIAELTTELGKLPKVSGGIKNALENLGDSATIALDKLGRSASNAISLEDLANKISDQVAAIAEDFASLDPATQKTVLGFGAVAAGAGPVLVAFGTLAPAVVKGVESFKLMGGIAVDLAVAMGPVGIAVAAVAAGLVYFAATSKSATEEFRESAKSADDLASQLTPLLARYEELSKKTKLTADEQQNLKDTIQRIGEVTPGAITATDEYGKTMQISAGKAKEYLKVLQDIAKTKAAAALPDAEANYKDLSARLKKDQEQLDKLNKRRVISQPKFNSQGIQLPDEKITAESGAGIALRKELTEAINLTKKAQIEALAEVNKIRKTAGLAPIKDASDKQAEAAAEAEKRKNKAILDSKQQLEDDIKKLNETKDKLSKASDADRIAAINKEIEAKKKAIAEIDALGIGSKADKKDLSDLQKAQEAFRDGLRQANLELKLQGETFDVAGAKAKVYKQYLDKRVELDKTGQVEQTPQFKAAMAEYQALTEASKEFKRNADISGIFKNTEESIAATAEKVLGLGKYAGTAKEQVKLLEGELADALNGIAAMQKAGAGENNAFLIAEREHAKELTAELEKARATAKQVKIDDSKDDLLDALNGGKTPNKSDGLVKKATGNSFGDLLDGKAISDIEERVRKAQSAVKDLQDNGASQAEIEQAKDALAGLKGELDLTDLYAGAAEQAGAALGDIASVIMDGIGGIITGQTSLVDGLQGIFAKTLSIVGNFMKDFGKQLLLLGAGHVALGIATANPALVTAGGMELAAGGALTLAGIVVGAVGSAVTPTSGSSTTPTTSATSSPSTRTRPGDKQKVEVTLNFPPVIMRVDGNSLVGLLSQQKYRQTMR